MRIKKGFFIIFISFSALSAATAQSTDNSLNYVRPQSEQAGLNSSASTISFGLGFGGTYPYAGETYVENPNIILMGEAPVCKHAGPGSIDLVSYKSIYSSYTGYYTNYNYEQRWNYYLFGGKLSYHVTPFGDKKVELYAGGMIAYYLTTFTFTSNDPNYAEPTDPGYALKTNNYPNFFSLSIYAGFRSWITNHSSVWFEMGYGYTALAFGASYKI